MKNTEIDRFIDRARRAWLRRPEYTGRAAVISDSDIVVRNGREVVELRDGDELLAQFVIKNNGEIRYLHEGKY